jgi:hypothetical protein
LTLTWFDFYCHRTGLPWRSGAVAWMAAGASSRIFSVEFVRDIQMFNYFMFCMDHGEWSPPAIVDRIPMGLFGDEV